MWNNFSPFKIRVNVDACTTLRVAGDRDFFIIDVLYDGEGNKNTLVIFNSCTYASRVKY